MPLPFLPGTLELLILRALHWEPTHGHGVGAWIRLHHGQQADPQEFRDWPRGRIAHYKVPRYIWLVDEFPTTVTGKIQKFRIREIVAEWLHAPAGGVAGERAVTE